MTKYKNSNINEKLDIPDELMEIYRRPPESRTQNNINYLYQECKKLKFFQNLIQTNEKSQLMIREILSRVEFSMFSKGKIIYSYNDPIINMLFVFEGEINVYKRQAIQKVSSKKFFISPKKSPEKKKVLVYDYSLSKGDEYGKEEIKKEKREIQVDAKTKCIVGFLSTQDWILIFEKTNVLERNDIKEFLTKINIFKDINFITLNNFFDIIKIRKISKGDFLVKKGEPFDKIYIIRYGGFYIFFSTKIKITTQYDLNSFSNNKKRSESASIKYKFEKNCYDKLKYQIITLFKGEFIGDIEYYLRKEKYILFAKCIRDDTEVIEINLKTFESVCNKRMKLMFLNETKNKIDFFQKRCKEIKNVHKNKQFGLKNRFKLMIIQNIEEENKDVFDRMENKKKYQKPLNDKKFNTIVSSLSQKKDLFFTQIYKNNINNPLSLFFDKINNFKKSGLLNSKIKRFGSNKSPLKLSSPIKKTNINTLNIIRQKSNDIGRFPNLKEEKKIKDYIFFIKKNINDIIITKSNNTSRNKSHKLNAFISRNSSNKLNILTDSEAYDFKNMQNNFSKNFLIKNNSRELTNKISKIFSYKHKNK